MKFTFSFILLMLVGFSFGQSFVISPHDTAGSGEPGDSFELEVYIINQTAEQRTMLATRKNELLPDENWNTALCFGETCYPPYQDQVGGNIPANDSMKLSITFNTSDQPGYGEAMVVFEDYGSGDKDSVLFTMETSRQPVFTITYKDTTIQGIAGQDLEGSGYFHNISDDSIIAYVSRISNDIPESWSSVLCFNICLPPYLDTDSTKLGPGDSLLYKLTFFTDSVAANGSATLAFYTDAGTDTVKRIFSATTTPTSLEDEGPIVSGAFRLLGNYPNPFNPGTTIRYYLPKAAHVRITVFDILGKTVAEIADKRQTAGYQTVYFDARHLPSGAYFYRVQAGSRIQIRKMLLLK